MRLQTRGRKDHFRGYDGAELEGKYRCGSTRRAPGLDWGRCAGQGAVLEEPSQKGELAHDIHFWSLTGTGYLMIIMTCIKKHCIMATEIKTGGFEVGLTKKEHNAYVLLFCFR